ncbi:MAG: hypothetical protein ACM3SY_12960 [Candidatus Omnitrophota bacterium]
MKNLTKSKDTRTRLTKFVLVVVGILYIITGARVLHGEENVVLVTLRDDSTVKFQKDSFVFPWVTPEIKNETNCETFAFNPNDVKEIYILNPTLNHCDQRDDDWTFDVHFKNSEPRDGFIEITSEEVTGKLVETGKEQSILFQEIRKVSFQ